ncbi:MAG TPA: ERAP1-like C-terminal domain-containing protein, partial [Streptosporangiaceae bacterium]|nr:ERAP1-like C-terminal domain-containing protein [Streptosporangiaceae bacterium]
GRDNFLAGVRQYFGEHAWQNATLTDLLSALEQHSDRDLADWSKAWLETAGINTIRPQFELAADGTFSSFSVLQEAPASHPVLRPHRIAVGLYERTDGGLRRTRRVELDIAGDATGVPELVGAQRPDLVLVNDDDLTYAKVRLDDHSLRSLIDASGRFTDPLPGAICWLAAWDMVRDGEMATRDYLSLVLGGVDSIPDISVLQVVLRQVAAAVRRYGDPAWRPTGLAEYAAAVRELLQAAAPGSDEQLAYAVAFSESATAPEDLDLLAALLAGRVTIEGLAIDTDMRWRLLHRLVSRGAAGHKEINEELDRDRTDAGERHAAAAQAAIPTPEAKTAAWNEITGGAMANATFRAALGGFQDMDQDELLVPYAGRYFEVVARIWKDWGSDMAQYFAVAAYPRSVVSQQAIDEADAYLERTRPPAPLRRLLTEGRDDVARALRCRQRDGRAGA